MHTIPPHVTHVIVGEANNARAGTAQTRFPGITCSPNYLDCGVNTCLSACLMPCSEAVSTSTSPAASPASPSSTSASDQRWRATAAAVPTLSSWPL